MAIYLTAWMKCINFLKNNFMKPMQEVVENLNIPISIKKLTLVKNLLTKKILGPVDFIREF